MIWELTAVKAIDADGSEVDAKTLLGRFEGTGDRSSANVTLMEDVLRSACSDTNIREHDSV
jgi:hypothetical protein